VPAVTIPGSRGSGTLTSTLLRGLDPGSARPGPEAVHLSEAAVNLLAACLAGCTGSRTAVPTADSVVLAAQRYGWSPAAPARSGILANTEEKVVTVVL
jgi:hypothetical protein